jgi:hypothetical protein
MPVNSHMFSAGCTHCSNVPDVQITQIAHYYWAGHCPTAVAANYK